MLLVSEEMVEMGPRSPLSARPGVGVAFGTFGELLQGVLPGQDLDFLVTNPIARYSKATFYKDPEQAAIQVVPARKVKSQLAAQLTLSGHGAPGGGTLVIDSAIPEGKGFASSSADLVAVIRAVGDACGFAITPTFIEDLLRQIEPSDGVMYSGVVIFHHRAVRLHSYLGVLPPLTIVGIDEGGQVNTIDFNGIPKPFSVREKDEYGDLLTLMARAVRVGNGALIGHIATRSAQLNQRLNPKRTLDSAIDISQRIGALGVMAAHSGTTVGILLDEGDRYYYKKLRCVITACEPLAESVTVDRCLQFTNSPLAARPQANRSQYLTPAVRRMAHDF